MLAISTRIDSIEPERVRVTVRSRARIRVRGNALGYLRCGGERCWVWGRFDKTFRIEQRSGEVRISAVGLGGHVQRSVPVTASTDLAPPRAARSKLRVRWLAPRAPRLRALHAKDLFQPEDSTP